MRTQRKPDVAQPLSVLRDVVMHAQPHALLRPGRVPAASKLSTAALIRAERAGEALLPLREAPGYDQGLAEGLAKGRSEGSAEAQADGQEAVRLAIESARGEALEQGREDGLRQGLERGEAQARESAEAAQQHASREFAQRLARLENLLAEGALEKARMIAASEEDLVAIAHDAICLILGAEAARPDAIVAMVGRLVAQHGNGQALSVHVNPDDLEALRSMEGSTPKANAWNWVADGSVQMGGVILRSPQGSLDARLEVQMQALREALLAVRRERKAQPSQLAKAA